MAKGLCKDNSPVFYAAGVVAEDDARRDIDDFINKER